MRFDPFEVSPAHVSYALLGGFVVVFGMFSLWIRSKLYISEAVIATVFGIIVGPYCANIFDPRSWGGGADGDDPETLNKVVLEVMRVILAIGVFAIGVELPKAYLWHHMRSIILILFPVMTWGWLVCAALIYGLVPGLSFLSSLIVAACLTPTDPILASAVIGGKWADKHVPAHLRHLLAAESAVNDGLAFPFLYLGLYLFLEPSAGTAIGEWVYWTWLYEIALGCTIGTVLGVGFRHLMQFCERKDLIDRTSYLAQYISLALLAIGVTTLLGSDDLLAAFFAGTGFGWNGFFQKQTEDSMFSNAMDLLLNIAAFLFIGAWLPFSSFADPRLTLSVWRLVVLGILIMLVRRLPACVAVYPWIPDIKTLREAVFTGHFGPMGVGAVFISTLAATQLPSKGALGDPPYSQEQLLSASIQPIVGFIVLCSILIHGLSVPGFSLSKRVHSISRSTRTWSRHASDSGMGPRSEPEWTQQARMVTRPEDVIINRDPNRDIEKGPAEEDEPEHRRRAAHTEGREEDVPSGSGTRTHMESGDEISTKEWREGPYVVKERDAGHGEEVEVEVLRATASDVPEVERRETFTGTAEEARRAGRQYIEGLESKARRIAKDMQVETREIGRMAEGKPSNVRGGVEKVMRDVVGGQREDPSTEQEGSEEEWRDEDPEPESPEAGPSKRRRSPQSMKRPLMGRPGRRRESFRRIAFGRQPVSPPRPAPIITSSPTSSSSSFERGRTVSPQSSITPMQSVERLRSPPTHHSTASLDRPSVHFSDSGGTTSSAETPTAVQGDSGSGPRVRFDSIRSPR